MWIYLTIIRRRRSEYWWIFLETKSRGIFTNIHEPEANNCFSIITEVIIEIPKQRIDRKMLNFICHCHASMKNQAHGSRAAHGKQTISPVISPVFPPD